jgi:hypothetical protein
MYKTYLCHDKTCTWVLSFTTFVYNTVSGHEIQLTVTIIELSSVINGIK